jgi:pimeloyl-ACP methyl ester carboxylesterase
MPPVTAAKKRLAFYRLNPCILLLVGLIALAGCAAPAKTVATDHPTPPPAPVRPILIIVPGALGNLGYAPMLNGLAAAGIDDDMQTFTWGAPSFLFFLNFQTTSIHHSAEAALAARIEQLANDHPGAAIDLIGHSAGCGVILGALPRLPLNLHVRTVLLLAPSVSPTYDLTPSLPHVSGHLHVFYSNYDKLFLYWRTGTFGTYDNVRIRAAGNCGFSGPSAASPIVIQHPYDPTWKPLGNDASHTGTLAEPFAKSILAPLLIVRPTIQQN